FLNLPCVPLRRISVSNVLEVTRMVFVTERGVGRSRFFVKGDAGLIVSVGGWMDGDYGSKKRTGVQPSGMCVGLRWVIRPKSLLAALMVVKLSVKNFWPHVQVVVALSRSSRKEVRVCVSVFSDTLLEGYRWKDRHGIEITFCLTVRMLGSNFVSPVITAVTSTKIAKLEVQDRPKKFCPCFRRCGIGYISQECADEWSTLSGNGSSAERDTMRPQVHDGCSRAVEMHEGQGALLAAALKVIRVVSN
ncbi:hypothetical protein Tco_0943950, partial [Tanacetum coccineum]